MARPRAFAIGIGIGIVVAHVNQPVNPPKDGELGDVVGVATSLFINSPAFALPRPLKINRSITMLIIEVNLWGDLRIERREKSKGDGVAP